MNKEVTKLARMNQDSLSEVLTLKRKISNALLMLSSPAEYSRADVARMLESESDAGQALKKDIVV